MVRGCLSSANFSILINGAAKGNFRAGRGLRQEDTLSPFLFCFVVDALGSLISKARNLDLVEGVFVGRDRVHFSHIQFVNDTLLFSSYDKDNFQNLLIILKIFQIVYGLKVNLNKTELASIN